MVTSNNSIDFFYIIGLFAVVGGEMVLGGIALCLSEIELHVLVVDCTESFEVDQISLKVVVAADQKRIREGKLCAVLPACYRES